MVSYSDYARKLDGLALFGLGLKPHRLGSHRYHRFPQIFRPMRSDKGHADFADDADFDLLGLGFCRFREILLMTCRILCFILGGFEEKAYFCGRSVKYRRN